jgi:hypothetical protein
MADTPSRLYRQIERGLAGGTLADFVAARRATQSWRRIAEDVYAATGVEVSWESLRTWFDGRIEVVSTVVVKDAPGRAA